MSCLEASNVHALVTAKIRERMPARERHETLMPLANIISAPRVHDLEGLGCRIWCLEERDERGISGN
jgi:hypothetical protein